ncbi:MAG: precorrin-2 C(20)-methyltransferase [Lachnospiraceae bacterium]|nr:precorrin-2 C(20)-methyltransferase [Lachnospiraceae bacterium]
MENSAKYFENRSCDYYPCHKGMEELNCLFCYCPFYGWEECPGKNEYVTKKDGRRIKVCTDCTFPHVPGNWEKVVGILKMGQQAYYKEKHPLPCKFYGIGVGPGEASLITKKASQILKLVDVLVLPGKKENCRAYDIAVEAMPEIAGKECVFLPFPMSMKEPELTAFHRAVAEQVTEFLKEGKSVGFLSIGDVTIYSTYAYVEQLVAEAGWETEYVNGIPSFLASAARLGVPLTLGSEEMHIIPGSADVETALMLPGTLVFMKSGKKLLELKTKLIELSKVKDMEVMAVSNCGMQNELVTIGAEKITEENGYLTVVIVRKKTCYQP